MQKTLHYVYEYLDPRTEKVFYVGLGKGHRWLCHTRPSMLSDSSPKSELIKEIMSVGQFPIIRKVAEDLSLEEACSKEKDLIAYYGKENLTNRTSGGQGHPGSKSFLGKTHTPETKEKLRIAKLGSRNPMYGKPRSEESLAKFRESMKGISREPVTEETKAKIANSLKGRKQSPDALRSKASSMKARWDAWKNGTGPHPFPNRVTKH